MTDKEMTLDEKMKRLSELVAWFEGDEFKLEDSQARYNEVKRLADELRQEIDRLEQTFTPVDAQSK